MKFYLIGPYYPLRGGIAQYLALLGQKLIERGHEVKVLAFRKQFPKFLFPGQTQIEASQDYIHLPSEAILIPWNPLTWCKTFRKAKQGKPHAVIFKYWMPFFAPAYAAVCALIKWFTSIKTIFIIDNVIPHEKRPGDRWLTRLAFRWVDGFIVQSDLVRRDLERWFPEAKRQQVFYVPHPVYDCYSGTEQSREEARQQLGLSAEKKVLLFFGLVRRYKGLDVLIEALPEVLSQLGPDVHLVIVGEFYEPERDYRAQIDNLKLDDHITLINQYIPNEAVSQYFQAADLLVLPYRSATQSGVIQVAFHFGLPVISTRVGGLPEVVREGETGFLVEPENPRQLASAIVRFFHEANSTKLRDMIKTQRSHFSWEEMVKALVTIATEHSAAELS